MSDSAGAAVLSIGDLARECGVAVHKMRYAVEEYSISPVQRAGAARLWSRSQLPEIRAALARIAERRREALVGAA